MRDEVKAANRVADIAADQTQAVKDSAEAAKDSASIARTVIGQNEKLVKAAETQASVSQTSADATVEGARIAAKVLYIGNRPFIGASDVTVANLEDGKEPIFAVRLKKHGQNPSPGSACTCSARSKNRSVAPKPRFRQVDTAESGCSSL